MLSFLAQRTVQRSLTFYAANYARSRVTSLLPMRNQALALSTTASLLAAAATVKTASQKKAAGGAKTAKKPAAKTAKKSAVAKKPKAKTTTPPVTLRTMKIKKEQLPPKAAPNGYLLFHSDYFAKNNLHEFGPGPGVAAGLAWHALSDSERAVYNDRSRVLREQHRGALEQYMNTVDPKIIKAINIQRRAKGIPKVRGSIGARFHKKPTSFTLFVRENSQTVDYPEGFVGIKKGQHMFGVLGKRWRELSEADKASYKDRAKSAQ